MYFKIHKDANGQYFNKEGEKIRLEIAESIIMPDGFVTDWIELDGGLDEAIGYFGLIEIDPKYDIMINTIRENMIGLEQELEQQGFMIEITNEAVDFLLLTSLSDSNPFIVNTLLRNTNKEGGNVGMAAYIAMRIIQKGKVSLKAGQDYYRTYLSHPSYKAYKEEVDLILMSEGWENLIVDLG